MIKALKYIFLLLFCFSALTGTGQNKKTRILFIMDASSSMTYDWNKDYKRFDIGSDILLQIIDSIYALNNEVEFGVRIYGSQYPAQDKNCADTKLEIPFNVQNVQQIKQRLKYVTPIGSSPIALSLEEAAEKEMSEMDEYDYSIIFITDGGENCGGDICKVYETLLAKRVSVTPYIIGLDNNEYLKSFYTCIGKYVQVNTTADIPKAVKLIVDANRPILNKPQVLNLATTFSNTVIKNEEPKDEVKPVKVLSKSYLTKMSMKNLPEGHKVKNIEWHDIPIRTYKNDGEVLLTFNIDQEPESNERQPFNLTKMNMLSRQEKDIPLIRFKIASLTKQKNNLRTTLSFNLKQERDTDVFPRMLALSANKSRASHHIRIPGKLNTRRNELVSNLIFDIKVLEKTVIKGLPRIPVKMNPGKNDLQIQKLSAKKNGLKASIAFEISDPKPKIQLQALRPLNTRYRITYALRNIKSQPKTNTLRTNVSFTYTEIKRDTIVKIVEPVKTKSIPGKDEIVNFEVQYIPHNSTSVQVYFINKNNRKKIYNNIAPDIDVIDVTSNQKILTFTRKIVGGGPENISFNPGTYDFIVKGKNYLAAKNVVIKSNKVNKVIIEVSDGTLQFAYRGNPGRRVEYQAYVDKRFERGNEVIQSCTEKRYYEPGNYYIQINTLPPEKFNTDISFGAISEIQIPEPGNLIISNTNRVGKINFLYDLAGAWTIFHDMEISGQVANQKVTLQPGTYKIEYLKDPNVPQIGVKVATVRITGNQETYVILE